MNYSIDWDGPGERDRDEDIVKVLRRDVFYGDERLARMKEHNPMHMVAADEIEKLRAALAGMVLVCGRTGNVLDDFEEQAEAFYRETGYMRPGKDFPAAGDPGRANHEMRFDRYIAWVQSKIEAGRAALSKAGA